MVFVSLGQLQKHREMGVFGHSIAPRVDLQPPLNPVDDLRVGINYSVGQL